MGTMEWAVWMARVVVIAAAAIALVPLARRSLRPRLTLGVSLCGIVLALIPAGLQVMHALGGTPSSSTSILSRLDAPGFSMILFGVVLGLREMCRTRDRLYEQNRALKQAASTDYLTGLLNRRQAEFLLDYGTARARRSGEPMGFIMIDLDHFKDVNDTHGHRAGDAVLAHVGILLKSRIRSSDILARYGGEEFLLVLPGPTQQNLLALAEELRTLIERDPAEHAGKEIPITASFGLAMSYGDSVEAVEECISKADAALYRAKALGRNRVVLWEQRASEEATGQPCSQQA